MTSFTLDGPICSFLLRDALFLRQDGKTLLMWSCENGSAFLVELALQYLQNAHLDWQDKVRVESNRSKLMLSTFRGCKTKRHCRAYSWTSSSVDYCITDIDIVTPLCPLCRMDVQC